MQNRKSVRTSLLCAAVSALTLLLQTRQSLAAYIASFQLTTPSNAFQFTNHGAAPASFDTLNPSTHLTAVSVPVLFQYQTSNAYSPDLATQIAGTLTLTSTASASTITAGGSDFQALSALSLTFTADSPVDGHTNLLTVTGTGLLKGRDGGQTAALSADTSAGNSVAYTSDFLDFTNSTLRVAALSFTSLTPNLSKSSGHLSTFTAFGDGTFSDLEATGSVPEPASLALLASGALLFFRRPYNRRLK